jgi:predicted dienelactone hydrolase
MIGSTSLPASLGLSLALMLGCNPGEPAPEPVDPLQWAVDEPGPFAVGYRSYEITYPGLGDGDDRTIPLHVWYPTEDSEGSPATYEFIFSDENSWVDAAPAQAVHSAGYPVLVYSHGNQGFGGSSSFLNRNYASHGWVVIAPDHINNTLSTHQDPRPLDLFLDRSGDVSAALDSLEDDGAALPSPADTSRVVAAGHSFGCHTLWSSMGALFDVDAIQARCDAGNYSEDECSAAVLAAFATGTRDDRIVATIPMAGGGDVAWFGQDGLLGAQTPILQISGTDDPGAVDGVWDRTEGLDLTWMVVEGGCHQLFGLGGCPEISDEDGFRIVRSYTLAFGRKHVLGDSSEATSGLLDGSIDFDAAVSIEQR